MKQVFRYTYYTTKKQLVSLFGFKTLKTNAYKRVFIGIDDNGFFQLLSNESDKSYTIPDTTVLGEGELFQLSTVWDDSEYACNFENFVQYQKILRTDFENYPVKVLSTGNEQYRQKVVVLDAY